MDRRVAFQKITTISDHPLLIGEILRRSALRDVRRAKWRGFLQKIRLPEGLTIYLALPLVCAHWAIVRGWVEPRYLRYCRLMPAGAVVVYTPKDREELAVCYSLFFEAYYFACKVRQRDD
jgi:hypothetical protein